MTLKVMPAAYKKIWTNHVSFTCSNLLAFLALKDFKYA